MNLRHYRPRKVRGTHIGIAVLDKWHQKIFTDTVKLTEQQLSSAVSEFIVQVPAGTVVAGVYYTFGPKVFNFG
jgi:hypothetical protein